MRLIKVIFRLILGIVFTFSGFVKSVDPLGSAYKFSDYFTDAFGMSSLSTISLALAFLLSAFEFLVGICLIINVKPRLSSLGAVLFMLIFTPLTLYIAIANPVSDCGCFGDAIKIGNWETFIKNLIMLPMAFYLFKSTKGESNNYKASIDWSLSGLMFLGALLFQYYNYEHLPVMDYRPYKVGTYIPEKMIIPKGEKTDSFSTMLTLINVATNEKKDVDEATYMSTEEFWDDTKWVTDTMKSVLVYEGYKPPVYNFTAYPIVLGPKNIEISDKMDALLADENYSFFVVAYDLTKSSKEGFDNLTELLNYAYTKDIRSHLLTSTTSNIQNYRQMMKFPVTLYNSDPTTLKTVIRSNPGLLLMKKGKVIGKWHYNDIPSKEDFEEIIANK